MLEEFGMSKKLSDKLAEYGITDLGLLKQSYSYIDDINTDEFEELKSFFINNELITDDIRFQIDYISDRMANSLCENIESEGVISIENKKIRICMACLFLSAYNRNIISYQFFSQNDKTISIKETSDNLDIDIKKVMDADRKFLEKIKYPARGLKLRDYLD